MAAKKQGRQSLVFPSAPAITHTFTIVGPMEGKGPLGYRFDTILEDTYYGERTWEKTETKVVRETVQHLLQKANLPPEEVDFILAGDLLDQIVASNFALRELPISFFGLFGACSTMAEALALSAILVEGGFGERAIAVSSSHHNTAERQYRFPTELGTQRSPTAQWTVTGTGAALVCAGGQGPHITGATIGKVIDMGAKDPNDMGSAMAPAAADTIVRHFQDFNRSPDYYDLIVTGDLGKVGLSILHTLLQQQKVDPGPRLSDCGLMIYRPDQDVHAGGSGCGCSAVVFCGHLYKELLEGKNRRLLLVGTGALLSPLTYQQNESIPAIAHAVAIEV
ncbi:MAG: stage V sporulation protein AD [Bacillota bacterium]|nr:stage V sporulation protein AD [Bacillota bacterium]